MDALSFIASLIRSLAWPGVVVFFVWYFAHPLAEMLLTVSRFRYKDLEVDFGKEIQEVKASAEKALPPIKQQEGPPSQVCRGDVGIKTLRKLILPRRFWSPGARSSERWVKHVSAMGSRYHRRHCWRRVCWWPVSV